MTRVKLVVGFVALLLCGCGADGDGGADTNDGTQHGGDVQPADLSLPEATVHDSAEDAVTPTGPRRIVFVDHAPGEPFVLRIGGGVVIRMRVDDIDSGAPVANVRITLDVTDVEGNDIGLASSNVTTGDNGVAEAIFTSEPFAVGEYVLTATSDLAEEVQVGLSVVAVGE